MESKAHSIELDKLVGLFLAGADALGGFQLCAAQQIPEPQKSLLNHDSHMTVTLEKFHSSSVNLVVEQDKREGHFYSREIRLKKSSDGEVVQYGIVRLNFNHLDESVQSEIVDHSKPLGRILIDHNVLRQVKLLSLYEIAPSPYLAGQLDCAANDLQYGRTAVIYCNEEPAIELLEIVKR